MKIEKINENKIRITISLTDLEAHNIDISTLNYNSPQAQELFWDLMEQAETEYGFDTSDSQLCIEAMPLTPEGFVIVVTKMDAESDFESIHKYIKNKFRKSDLKVKRKTKKISSTLMIYAFDSFDDLCALSSKVFDIYSGESSLYKCNRTYYLILVRNNITGMDIRLFDSMVCEYGKKVSNVSFYDGYLSEHGEKIMEYDAVETLVRYFA